MEEIKECTLIFKYEDGSQTFKIEYVGNQSPYRFAKWLFTQMKSNHPYFSYQCEDDDELYILIAKNTLTAKLVTILSNEETNNSTPSGSRLHSKQPESSK